MSDPREEFKYNFKDGNPHAHSFNTYALSLCITSPFGIVIQHLSKNLTCRISNVFLLLIFTFYIKNKIPFLQNQIFTTPTKHSDAQPLVNLIIITVKGRHSKNLGMSCIWIPTFVV